MSGGEQQMCAIGRALMARPKLLLLDEPSMGLAPIFVERIFETIVEINKQGTPVLLVEQNALMALDVAHRGYVLETGRIALEGPASRARRRTSRSARPTSARAELSAGSPTQTAATYGGASRTPTRARPPATPCAISSALAIEWLGTKPSAARRPRRGSRRRRRGRAAQSAGCAAGPVGVRKQRMARAAGAVGGERARRRGRARSAAASALGVGPLASASKTARYGSCVAVRERARERVDEDERAAVADREGVAPEPEREPERDRRRRDRVQRLARQVRPDPRHADDERVERLVEPSAAKLDRRAGAPRRARPTAVPANAAVAASAPALVAQDVAPRRRPGGAEYSAPERRARDVRRATPASCG